MSFQVIVCSSCANDCFSAICGAGVKRPSTSGGWIPPCLGCGLFEPNYARPRNVTIASLPGMALCRHCHNWYPTIWGPCSCGTPTTAAADCGGIEPGYRPRDNSTGEQP